MKTNHIFTATLVLILLSALHSAGYAQQSALQPPHVDFMYDAAGNRVLRYIAPQRLRSDTEKRDEVAGQIAEKNGILVYPNPVQDDNVNVSLASFKSEEPSTIYVLDNTGKTVVSQKASSSITQLNLSAYSAGIYYVKVMAGKEELFYKITKAK